MVEQKVRIINGQHKGMEGYYIEDYYKGRKRMCVVEIQYQHSVEFDYDDVEFVEE